MSIEKHPVLSQDQILESLKKQKTRDYYAMYSSWLKGIVTEPWAMLVPVDDHIVHRGDGVFEAFKFCQGHFYDFDGHFRRLLNSARKIGLEVPMKREEVLSICRQLQELSPEKDLVFRLYVSRGPGSFTPHPYDTLGSQLYIITTPYKAPDQKLYENGVRVMISKVPAKVDPYCSIKSCNYLQNVMAKKEALDNGVDIAVTLSKDGFVSEGPTENICMISKEMDLLSPSLDMVLEGTTMMVIFELAEKLIASGRLRSAEFRNLKPQEFIDAKEVFMVGTTIEVLPVVEFDGQPVDSGRPGMISRDLRALLHEDMQKSCRVT